MNFSTNPTNNYLPEANSFISIHNNINVAGTSNQNEIKYDSSIVFNETIPLVWNVLKKESTINYIFISSIISFQKESIDIPSNHTLNCLTSQISSYQKTITYISTPLQITFIFSLISNTLEKSTLLSLQLISNNSFITMNDLQTISDWLFRGIDEDLKTNLNIVKHYESTTIKANINVVWNFFINWELDKLKDKDYSNIEMKGKTPLQIGTSVNFLVDNEFNSKCHVLFVDKDKDSITWKFGFKLDACRLNVSEICLTFVKINENITFFAFETLFTQHISQELDELLTKKRRRLFKEVKKYFENTNYYNENN